MSEGHPDDLRISKDRGPGHEMSAATDAIDRAILERIRPWAEWASKKMEALERRIEILESLEDVDGGTKPPPPPPPPPPDPEV